MIERPVLFALKYSRYNIRQGKKNDGDFLYFFFRFEVIVDAFYNKKRGQIGEGENSNTENKHSFTASYIVVGLLACEK